MGSDAVFARHISDQSDRLQNALRSGQRRVRGFRRILHRHPIAPRRIVPPATTLVSPRDRARSQPAPDYDYEYEYERELKRMGDRVVDCARLESVCAERHRGFESPPIRWPWLGLLPLPVDHFR